MNRIRVLSCITLCLVICGAGCSKQSRKNRYIAQASKDLAAGKYDRAEVGYVAALRIPPPNPVALSQLGKIYFEQGKNPQAYAHLNKALELTPDDLESRILLGRTLLSMRKVPEAREHLSKVLDKQPGNGQALLAFVETMVSTNQPETLIRLNNAPEAQKSKSEWRVARATFLLRIREFEAAEAELKQALETDPKASDAHLALGNVHLLRTNLAEAEKELKLASDLAAPRSRAKMAYAEFKLRSGSAEIAKQLVSQITTNTPDYIPAWTLLAQIAFSQSKPDECSKLLETILARDRLNPEALMLKGDLLLAKADSTNAIVQFEKIQSTYGKLPPVQYRLALAALQQKETAKALALLDDVISAQPTFTEAVLLKANLQIRSGDTRSAIASLNQLIKAQPQLAQGYTLLAEAYLSQRNVDQAISVYERMSRVFPKSPDVHLLLGNAYAAKRRLPEARQAYASALDIAPDYLAAHEKLVDLDLDQRKFEDALNRVKQRISASTNAAGPWLLCAKVHVARALDLAGITNAAGIDAALQKSMGLPQVQTEVREAESALMKAIDLSPNSSMAYMMLAQLHVRLGRHGEAVTRLSPLAMTNHPGALLQLGIIHSELKNYPAARDAYEKLLSFNPNSSVALNNLAFIYTDYLPDLEKAYAMAQKARDLLPHDPRTADTLGWVLVKRGDYARAVSLLQDGASRLKLDPEVQYHLGLAHYLLGEEGPARVALERAVQDGKVFPWHKDATDRLALLNVEVDPKDAGTVNDLKQRLARDPKDPVLLAKMALAQELSGDKASAAATYQSMLNLQPRNSRVLWKLARLESENASTRPKALERAKEAHAISPEDAEINHFLGRLVFESGDHKWAVSLLQEAARRLTDNTDVQYDLAWANYAVGDLKQAESNMKVVLEKATQKRDSAEFVKFVKLAAGDPVGCQQAGEEARELLKVRPDFIPAKLVAAIADERQAHYDAAKAAYEQILQAYPLFSPALRNLALLYTYKSSDVTKALQTATKAREALPQDPEIAKALGILLHKKSDYSRALDYLEEYARTKAEDGETQFYIGMAHHGLKQNGESIKALERALNLELEPTLQTEAQTTLALLRDKTK